MLIKLLRTLLFFAFFAALTWLSQKHQRLLTSAIESGRARAFAGFLISIAMPLMILATYWSLTGLFSMTGVLALIALTILGRILYALVGAISGFALQDREQKIGTLGLILGAQTGYTHKWIFWSAGLLGILNPLAMLIIFWIYPFRDPTAIVWITFLQFILGQVLTAAVLILVAWPMVTSEYVDNDLRDSHLTGMFSLLFTQTALLLIAATLAEPSLRIVCARHGWSMPNIWLVVALPMITFIFAGVLPFFIGIFRRRAEEKRVNEWHVEWLNRISELLKLPAGEARDRALKQQIHVLHSEIVSRYSNNTLYEFYEKEFYDVTVTRTPDFDESLSQRLLTGDAGPDEASPFPRKRTLPGVPLPTPVQELQAIIARNYENLFKWDLRFKNLRNMLQLREIMIQPEPALLAPYVEAQLKTAEASAKVSGQARSVIAGAILGGFSWLASWVTTNYGKVIVGIVQRAIAE